MLTSVNPYIQQNLIICPIELYLIYLMTTLLLVLLEFQKVSVYKQTDGQTSHTALPLRFNQLLNQSIICINHIRSTDPAWLSCTLHAQSYGVVIVPSKCARLVSRTEFCTDTPTQMYPANCINSGPDRDDHCNICKT